MVARISMPEEGGRERDSARPARIGARCNPLRLASTPIHPKPTQMPMARTKKAGGCPAAGEVEEAVHDALDDQGAPCAEQRRERKAGQTPRQRRRRERRAAAAESLRAKRHAAEAPAAARATRGHAGGSSRAALRPWPPPAGGQQPGSRRERRHQPGARRNVHHAEGLRRQLHAGCRRCAASRAGRRRSARRCPRGAEQHPADPRQRGGPAAPEPQRRRRRAPPRRGRPRAPPHARHMTKAQQLQQHAPQRHRRGAAAMPRASSP